MLNFVNKELLPGTGITRKKFWKGLDRCVHELAPKNKNLLGFREILQKKIDIWHRDRKGKKINYKKYLNFLREIGYLNKETTSNHLSFDPINSIVPVNDLLKRGKVYANSNY